MFFKKMIKIERFIGIQVIYNRHCIPFHPMFFQQVYTVHHLLPRSITAWRTPVSIVKPLQTIYRNAHQPIIFLEKFAPFIRQQCSVGLYGICDLPSTGIFSL